jgi:hypothetical protein
VTDAHEDATHRTPPAITPAQLAGIVHAEVCSSIGPPVDAEAAVGGIDFLSFSSLLSPLSFLSPLVGILRRSALSPFLLSPFSFPRGYNAGD